MRPNRREVLSTFGIASAHALLFGLGCSTSARTPRRAPQVSGEVRTWLRDAVARLAGVYPLVHALAVSRHRTVAAVDVLGSGVARTRSDGVVFTVRGNDGAWREQVTSELTSQGIEQALKALDAPTKKRPIEFGRAPPTPAEPPRIEDRDLQRRVEEIMARDAAVSSRIVYAAALIDIDDSVVWSVAPGRDLEQRLVRVRKRATRAAWNGTRPIVAEIERAWTGGVDEQELSAADVTTASETALKLMTPGAFEDGERTIVLDPTVVAIVVDAAVRTLLTSAALRRPEVARRLASGPSIAAPLVTLTDDPTVAGAYGGFAFDDEGAIAEPIKLLDAGRVVGRLSDRASGGGGRGRRAGHVARVEPAPSHLRIEPGAVELRQLFADGWMLEGGIGATVDPGSDRIVVSVARARELKGDHDTGRIYADVELVGSLAQLLAAIDGISREAQTIAFRGDSDREPQWRSIAAPAVRTRGLVRARRRRA